MYRGNKSNSTDDYDKEMCWEVFSDCCVKKLFPAIQKTGRKSVLVLDRATYHIHLFDEDRRPTTEWRNPVKSQVSKNGVVLMNHDRLVGKMKTNSAKLLIHLLSARLKNLPTNLKKGIFLSRYFSFLLPTLS